MKGMSQTELNLLNKAAKFAEKKHKKQKDDSGNDYFMAHCVPVSVVLAQVICDVNLVCAGYLHDTIEDTKTTHKELIKEFNKDIADLVLEVTHEGKKDQYGYYFPRLKTTRGIMLKFADRLSNLSRMDAWSTNRQAQYLRKSKFWRSSQKDLKPASTVDCIVPFNHDILLIRRLNPPFRGKWALPGGFIDYNEENLEQAAIRELKEETGLIAKQDDLKLIGCWSNPNRDPRDHHITHVYEVTDFKGKLKAGDDATVARFFHWETIWEEMKSELAFDHKQILKDYFLSRGWLWR
jgi:ADP-ribose pyrophosphatase YjhB (NUDIX family)